MTQNWIAYEGHAAGTWRLDSFLGTRDGMAVYESSHRGGASIVKILTLDDERAGAARNSWTQATPCIDSHLLRVYDTGETELDGVGVIFAVMEKTDVGVEEILAERPVSEDEARSLVLGVASALDYLHQRGLQHGSVLPSQIYVVGDVVKLGVDTISTAAEGGWKSDMRQLGATLTDSMSEGEHALPAPFQAIASGCLGEPGDPWTARRVLHALAGNALAEPPAAGPAHRRWPLMATAVVVLFGVLGYWAVSEPVKHPAPAPVMVPVSPVVSPPIESTRARTVTPVVKSTTTQAGWAVIAAAYVGREAAEGRAAQIAKHSSGLHPSVFTSRTGARMSYVLLGAGLTRTEAEKVLRTARQAGAPRDSYVTKLIEK